MRPVIRTPSGRDVYNYTYNIIWLGRGFFIPCKDRESNMLVAPTLYILYYYNIIIYFIHDIGTRVSMCRGGSDCRRPRRPLKRLQKRFDSSSPSVCILGRDIPQMGLYFGFDLFPHYTIIDGFSFSP